MDAVWIAPVVALVLGGASLLLAGLGTRRAAVVVVEARPRLSSLRGEVRALHADLDRVTARLQDLDRGAGTGTTAR